MTDLERKELKKLIVATAMYYGQEIADEVLSLFVEDLADLPFASVARAIGELRRDPKTTRFPLPAVIRERLMPSQNPEGEARECASRISWAVSKFGSHRSTEAKEFLGEIGWAVVTRHGGWLRVCEELNERTKGQFMAQWRDLALTLAERAKAGRLSDQPAISDRRGPAPEMTFDKATELTFEQIQKQLEQLKREEEKAT